MAIITSAGDPLDVCTIDDVKADLGTEDTADDVELQAYVTSVSRLLDEECGPIVQRTVTAERCDGGDAEVLLASWPIASVTSVTEYLGASSTALTEVAAGGTGDGFFVDLGQGALERARAGYPATWASGRKNVVVTYVAGRYEDTASVDERFRRAATIAAAQLWRRQRGMGTATYGPEGQVLAGATFALPNAARAFIEHDIIPAWARRT